MPSSNCALSSGEENRGETRSTVADMRLCARRPGDYLPHDADEIEGFKSRLNDRLAPTNPKEEDTEWEIGDCLAQWYLLLCDRLNTPTT